MAKIVGERCNIFLQKLIGPALTALLAGSPVPVISAPYFSGLGLPSFVPGTSSEAHDVSADGSVVTGFSTVLDSTMTAFMTPFVWTRSTGMVGFAPVPGQSSAIGDAISDDGSVVVGTSLGGPPAVPFRWTQAGGTQSLGFAGEGFEISADGSTIVGRGGGAWRWTAAGGRQFIGDPTSQAFGVSADGSVIIGNVRVSDDHVEAFRWTAAGGLVPLGELPGGAVGSQGRAVSNDGDVVAGVTSSSLGNEAFRWTIAGGMQGLGDLSGGSFSSDAIGISGDGSVIVGAGTGPSGTVAVYWDDTGIHDLRDVLVTDLGLDLTGWTLSKAYSASDDGKVIVGYGIDPRGLTEAFIADLHVPEPRGIAIVATGLFVFAMQRRRSSS